MRPSRQGGRALDLTPGAPVLTWSLEFPSLTFTWTGATPYTWLLCIFEAQPDITGWTPQNFIDNDDEQQVLLNNQRTFDLTGNDYEFWGYLVGRDVGGAAIAYYGFYHFTP